MAERVTGWHFDPQDTAQDKRILRQRSSAQTVRKRFPTGTRVRARHASREELGVVRRHVPGTNAQGGYLVVTWDSTGHTGRISPITVEPVQV